jgi:arylsulfatase A-like enzyme
MKRKVLLLAIIGFFLLNVRCGRHNLPNVIIILADDMGYGDLACYGSEKNRTPNIDRMAAEGIRFTDFYVSSGFCTPSRASLLTGCYPRRVDMHVNARPFGMVGRQVLFGASHKGLNANEITLAEILKSKGYATSCIGKWHLGDQEPFLPTRQGFDEYFGIPYSNDMNYSWCPLPLMRGEEVIEAPADQKTLTQRFTEEAIRFMEKNKDRPFFIYLPHVMVHDPLHASEAFRGKSNNGILGDAVEEVDWSVGQINEYLKSNGLDKNTLVIFTSDNGAPPSSERSNAPLSGWKGSTQEGGMREPCIMTWPAQIPRGMTSSELATTMDIVPTLAHLVGFEYPDNRIIDGHDIRELMTVKGAPSPTEVFYYYQLEQLQAVRSGKWKLLLPLDSMYNDSHQGTFMPGRELKLVNLSEDIREKRDVSSTHPDIVAKLLEYALKAREDLGDMGREGRNTRPAGFVSRPVPQLMKPVRDSSVFLKNFDQDE